MLVKAADQTAAYLEATQLAGFDLKEARKFFGLPKGIEGAETAGLLPLKPLAPKDASGQYLRKFKQLCQPA